MLRLQKHRTLPTPRVSVASILVSPSCVVPYCLAPRKLTPHVTLSTTSSPRPTWACISSSISASICPKILSRYSSRLALPMKRDVKVRPEERVGRLWMLTSKVDVDRSCNAPKAIICEQAKHVHDLQVKCHPPLSAMVRLSPTVSQNAAPAPFDGAF